MNLARLAFASTFAAATVVTLASEATEQQARMQQAMDRYCQAIKRHDSAAAARITEGFFSPTAVFIDVHGKRLSYPQWKTRIAAQMKTLASVDDISLKCNSFSISGKNGLSMERFHMKARIPGGRRLVVDSRSRVDCRKINGKWMVVKSTEFQNTTTINGKRVAM